jgi:hypothetical protein
MRMEEISLEACPFLSFRGNKSSSNNHRRINLSPLMSKVGSLDKILSEKSYKLDLTIKK